jgi:thiol-disulfide isomerase/thioredoxin
MTKGQAHWIACGFDGARHSGHRLRRCSLQHPASTGITGSSRPQAFLHPASPWQNATAPQAGIAMRRLVLFFCMTLTCSSLCAKSLPIGSVPPDDLGKTLDGQAVHASEFRGKVVVISFWATWCKYCMRELPVLGGLQAVAHKRDLPLQVVEINYMEDHSTFVRATHLLMPILPGLLLTWDRTGALNKSFGLSGEGLPAMVMLNRDGHIADEYVGYDKSELDPIVAEINKLMNEPAPPPPAAAHGVPASVPKQP